MHGFKGAAGTVFPYSFSVKNAVRLVILVTFFLANIELLIKMLQSAVGDFVVVHKEITALILLCTAFYSLLQEKFTRDSVIAFLAFSLFVAIGILLGAQQDPFAAAWMVRTTFLFPAILIMGLSTLRPRETAQIYTDISRLSIVFVFVNLALVTTQFVLGPEFYETLHIPTEGEHLVQDSTTEGYQRPSGMFRSLDVLGQFALYTFIMLSAHRATSLPEPRTPWLRRAYIAFSACLVVLSTSRTAIVALLAVFVTLTLIKVRINAIRWMVLPLLLAPVALTLSHGPVLEALNNLDVDEQLWFYLRTVFQRLYIWNDALDVIAGRDILNQLFGIGIGVDTLSDNMYIWLLEHFGVMGLAAFFVLLFFFVLKSRFAPGAIAFVAAVLYLGLASDYFQSYVNQLYGALFLICFAQLAVAWREPAGRPRLSISSNR
jgi:hypothetical protein